MHNYTILDGAITEMEDIETISVKGNPIKSVIFYISTEDGDLPVRAWGDAQIEQVQKYIHADGLVDAICLLKNNTYMYHNKDGEERRAVNVSLTLKRFVQ